MVAVLPNESSNRRIMRPSLRSEKSRVERIMPPTMGNMATKKSGSKSMNVTCRSLNFF